MEPWPQFSCVVFNLFGNVFQVMDLESRLSEAEKEAHTGKIISVSISVLISLSEAKSVIKSNNMQWSAHVTCFQDFRW